jgi:Domain of unknown function (DUF4253)
MSFPDDKMYEKDFQILESVFCGEIDGLPCKYYAIPGDRIIDAWKEARKLFTHTWPVIISHDSEDEGVFSSAPEETQSDLEKLDQFDVETWLNQRWGNYDFEDEDDALAEYFEEYDEPEKPNPRTKFTIPYDILTGEPQGNLRLMLIPTIPFAQIPIYMPYGGWNDCPYPHEIAAMMEYWNLKYGAELVGISHDTLEMFVCNPPTTYQDAFDLAKEHYAFCYDSVDQGMGTVERLAKSLINSSVWYFWWD